MPNVVDSIQTLSLCTGVGMLDIGLHAACEWLGWPCRAVGYCERDAFAAACLMARLEESSLEPAPLFCGNLEDLDARSLRGWANTIVAGFPCQPWSHAGKQAGTADERWLWPSIARIIRDTQPQLVYLENVPGLVSGGGLHFVLDDLAEMRLDAEWCHLTAEAVGASHRRERIFVLAYDPTLFRGAIERSEQDGVLRTVADGEGKRWEHLQRSTESGQPRIDKRLNERHGGREREPGRGQDRRAAIGGTGGAVVNAEDRRDWREVGIEGQETGTTRPCDSERADGTARPSSEPMGHASQPGLPQPQCDELSGAERLDEGRATGQSGRAQLFAPGPQADWGAIAEMLYPALEPGFRVLVDGRPVVLDESRADQLRCGGNGCVPLAAAVAFIELVRRAGIA